jgi:hypothetical protein
VKDRKGATFFKDKSWERRRVRRHWCDLVRRSRLPIACTTRGQNGLRAVGTRLQPRPGESPDRPHRIDKLQFILVPYDARGFEALCSKRHRAMRGTPPWPHSVRSDPLAPPVRVAVSLRLSHSTRTVRRYPVTSSG